MIGNAFLLAIRQIYRNPMRSFLTVLGIIIGVASVIIMINLGNGAAESIRQDMESLGSNQLQIRPGMRLGPGQKVGAPDFTEQNVQALRQEIAGVNYVAPKVQKSITLVANGRNWNSTVIGTTSDYFSIDNRPLESGRLFTQEEERTGAAVCLIGKTVQKELFGENANVRQRTIRVQQFSCRVIGVLASKGSAAMGGDLDDFVVMPLKTVQRRLLGNNKINNIMVQINENSDRERVKAAITQLMREQRSLSDDAEDNFQISDTEEFMQSINKSMATMTTLLAAVASVSLLVGGIGIMNIMLVSVTERTREIGVRLAIGALQKEVLSQFLIESMMLGLFGGLIGVVLAFGLTWFLSGLMALPFVFSVEISLLAFGISAIVGVVFGYFPARRAARLDPIVALRYE